MKSTGSISKGKMALAHDTREYYRRTGRWPDNVDPERSEKNVVLADNALEDVYRDAFEDARLSYNAQQVEKGHPERQIPDYLEKVRNDKKLNEGYEFVIQVGNRDERPPEQTCVDILRDWFESFNESYRRNFRAVKAVIHLDEATPHLHLSVVPVASSKRGLSVQNSLNKAVKEAGAKDYLDLMGQWDGLLAAAMAAHGVERIDGDRQKQFGGISIEAVRRTTRALQGEEAKRAALADAKAKLGREVAELGDERESASQTLSKLQAEAERARKDRDDALGELAAATTAAQQAVRQAADAAAEQAAAERERDTARAEADAARAWADTASASEERQAAALSEAYERREAEERREAAAKSRADAAEKAADASVRAAEAKSARECAEAEKESQKARESLSRVRGEVAAAEAERDAARADAASARGDRDAAQAELDGLRDEIQSARAELDGLRDDADEAERRRDEVQDELAGLREERAGLMRDLPELQALFDAIKRALDFLMTSFEATTPGRALRSLQGLRDVSVISDATEAEWRWARRQGGWDPDRYPDARAERKIERKYKSAQRKAVQPTRDAVARAAEMSRGHGGERPHHRR